MTQIRQMTADKKIRITEHTEHTDFTDKSLVIESQCHLCAPWTKEIVTFTHQYVTKGEGEICHSAKMWHNCCIKSKMTGN